MPGQVTKGSSSWRHSQDLLSPTIHVSLKQPASSHSSCKCLSFSLAICSRTSRRSAGATTPKTGSECWYLATTCAGKPISRMLPTPWMARNDSRIGLTLTAALDGESTYLLFRYGDLNLAQILVWHYNHYATLTFISACCITILLFLYGAQSGMQVLIWT